MVTLGRVALASDPNQELSYRNVRHRLANTAHGILIVKGGEKAPINHSAQAPTFMVVYDSQIVHFCDYNRIQTVVP